jgi:CRP/FNR family cyclic AMP-dependent transcriptional regulator
MSRVTGLFVNAQQTIKVPAGEYVFREDEMGTEMFGVITGRVSLRHGDEEIMQVGPDDILGELALIDQEPRSLDALALEDCELATIDRHRFLFLITETPTFALQVMTTMAQRLRAQR